MLNTRFIQSPDKFFLKGLLFANTFHGLFGRWMHKINAKDLEKVSSGVPEFYSFYGNVNDILYNVSVAEETSKFESFPLSANQHEPHQRVVISSFSAATPLVYHLALQGPRFLT